MKKVKKSEMPLKLKKYFSCNPTANWEEDFKNDCPDGYKEVVSKLKTDQGGICCYCELNFSDSVSMRDDFRVEHFHPKSDRNERKNWDLDWDNLLGCCHGGSERRVISGEDRYIENNQHRHSDVLKSSLVWDDEILNPLEIPAYPALFEVMGDGEMRVIESNCTPELKRRAMNSIDAKKLNLNSPSLKEWRKAVIDKLREDVYLLSGESNDIAEAVTTIVRAQLSKDNYGNFPKFFSTIRSYFKEDSEKYLVSVGYDG